MIKVIKKLFGTIFENMKLMKIKTTLLLTFSLLVSVAFAQDNSTATTVKVHKDPRLDELVKKQAEINTATKKAQARTMQGYRLLIVNTNKREEALDAKTKVYTYFPELSAYLNYQSPYYKLKAGNFKTRDEAAAYQKNLNIIFPKGVFIINDRIEVKAERDD
jgi:hypothetical protein